MTRRTALVLLALAVSTASCFGLLSLTLNRIARLGPKLNVPVPTLPPAAPLTPAQARIISGAKAQIGDAYDASYYILAYPNGDPPAGRGACSDVVVRGLRADGIDLQTLVHTDMTRHWGRYPHKWGLSQPDSNIDHRRVPNLAVFFRTHGKTLPNAVAPQTLSAWQPGDIVCWKMPGGGDHTGLISDRRDLHGIPLVIHNMGRCEEQDVLTNWTITGHYRYPK